MIVLDTNIVSELMRPLPDAAVEAWVADRAATTLFLSAVSEADARSRGMAVATRNVRHFEGMAVDLVDPWDAGTGWGH